MMKRSGVERVEGGDWGWEDGGGGRGHKGRRNGIGREDEGHLIKRIKDGELMERARQLIIIISVTILQGNVSFGPNGIREVHRLQVYQYRYKGELQNSTYAYNHMKHILCIYQQEVQ